MAFECAERSKSRALLHHLKHKCRSITDSRYSRSITDIDTADGVQTLILDALKLLFSTQPADKQRRELHVLEYFVTPQQADRLSDSAQHQWLLVYLIQYEGGEDYKIVKVRGNFPAFATSKLVACQADVQCLQFPGRTSLQCCLNQLSIYLYPCTACSLQAYRQHIEAGHLQELIASVMGSIHNQHSSDELHQSLKTLGCLLLEGVWTDLDTTHACELVIIPHEVRTMTFSPSGILVLESHC